MRPELIVMLTHHDKTVSDAIEMFQEMRETPVIHWGFKDVGLPVEKMKKLVKAMKAAGKITYLEVVSLSEPEGLSGAKLAVEAGFDILMGTVYFDSINQFLQDKPIQYYPFPGHVHSHPSILDGTIESIAQNARWLQDQGAHGLDLLTYRYTGDAWTLLKEVVKATQVPIVSAGSIDTYQRIAEVWDAQAWGFTIGSAFFEKKFEPEGTFKSNMMTVWNWLQEHDQKSMRSFLKE
jgi:hypothetical protein